MNAGRTLVVVTEDGFAKRVPLAEVRRTRRGAKGVRLSSVAVAVTLAVRGTDGELVVTTALGKVTRVAVRDVPMRRRRGQEGGRHSKGGRIVRLAEGDRVADVALVAHPAQGVAHGASTGIPAETWPWGRAGLRDGESVANVVVFHPPRPLESIRPGREPAVPRGQWARTDVHAASVYFCAHCGRQHPDPHAVYDCIDRHATAARTEPVTSPSLTLPVPS